MDDQRPGSVMDGDIDKMGIAGGNTTVRPVAQERLREKMEKAIEYWQRLYPHEVDAFKAQQRQRQLDGAGNKFYSKGKTLRRFCSIPKRLSNLVALQVGARDWWRDKRAMNLFLGIFEVAKFRVTK